MLRCPKCGYEENNGVELGCWALPAKSDESFKLNYTVEELTELIRNNKDKINEAMSRIQCMGPLHIPRKS